MSTITVHLSLSMPWWAKVVTIILVILGQTNMAASFVKSLVRLSNV